MYLRKDIGLLLLRVGAAVLLLTHGIPKFSKLIAGGEIEFGNPIGIGPTASLILAVVAEFVCPLLLIVGYKTRLAAIPPAVLMIIAAFIVHAEDPFSRKEKALLFFIMFLVVLIAGPGKYSLDKK